MNADGTREGRSGSLRALLARLGFADAGRAVSLLSDPGLIVLGDDADRIFQF